MTERRLRAVKARETCDRGHEVVVPVNPLERLRYRNARPETQTVLIRCHHPGCGCDVWLTAGAIQRAA